ncbi:3'-5'-exoribonuclease family protein isoform 1 [Hibiscus syriacus]|uniref:3'-5'-exoribonuclease family protein isoform 1 n=1 Tax=Hibiscus syriacus TaxID=106335 RepID=A0A6A3CG25_HIBSY|nr:3'-5'-exoribonuclease family protein isoform 1 [Hibiscus syriacus]
MGSTVLVGSSYWFRQSFIVRGSLAADYGGPLPHWKIQSHGEFESARNAYAKLVAIQCNCHIVMFFKVTVIAQLHPQHALGNNHVVTSAAGTHLQFTRFDGNSELAAELEGSDGLSVTMGAAVAGLGLAFWHFQSTPSNALPAPAEAKPELKVEAVAESPQINSVPRLNPRQMQFQDHFHHYPDLKPPTSPTPSQPATSKATLSPTRPLSPYAAYPDLKPPTSPTPSQAHSLDIHDSINICRFLRQARQRILLSYSLERRSLSSGIACGVSGMEGMTLACLSLIGYHNSLHKRCPIIHFHRSSISRRDTTTLTLRPSTGFRPPPRKPILPPSFRPKKKRSSCCHVVVAFSAFFSILIALLLIFVAVFYFWFNPKLPVFHVRSFQISPFNVTRKPNGTHLDAATEMVIEVKNPNGKMTYYFGDTVVDVSVGKGGDETELGTMKLPKFTSKKKSTTSLKVETKASNKQADDAVANRLLAGYKAKSLAVNVAAKTNVGLGVGGLKIGMLGVTVSCKAITMKPLAGRDTPNCVTHTLRWIDLRS